MKTLLKTSVILVTILGMVAVLCFTVVRNPDRYQRDNETRLQMQKIEQACKTYRRANGGWPEELGELIEGPLPLLEGGERALTDSWGKRMTLEVLPNDTVRVSTVKPDGTVLRWPER